jgi:thioredoxin 1
MPAVGASIGRESDPQQEVPKTIMTAPMTVDETTFEAEVLSSDKPVLVDFWAPWCGPCRLVSPVVESVGEAHADKISTAKVNTDENQQLAMRYSIFSIPTLILFKDGREAARLVGYMPQEAMEARLAQFLQ